MYIGRFYTRARRFQANADDIHNNFRSNYSAAHFCGIKIIYWIIYARFNHEPKQKWAGLIPPILIASRLVVEIAVYEFVLLEVLFGVAP